MERRAIGSYSERRPSLREVSEKEGTKGRVPEVKSRTDVTRSTNKQRVREFLPSVHFTTGA